MSKKEHKGTEINVGLGPALKEVAKQIAKPVYDDGLKNAVVQSGSTLETVPRLANAILLPLRLGIFAVEQIEPILEAGINKRLVAWKTRAEDLQAPPANVAVPAIEALRYTASIEELREMFLNLIAASMDASRASAVHPSFVEILKQLDPDEGRILKLFLKQKGLQHWSFEAKWHRMPGGYYKSGPTFLRVSLIGKDAGCSAPQKVPAYIDNLLRLGLVYEPSPYPSHAEGVESLRDPKQDKDNPEFFHTGERIGELVDLHPELEEVAASFKQNDYRENHFEIWRSELRLTEYGKAFCLSCVAADDPNGFLAFGARDEHLLDNRIRL